MSDAAADGGEGGMVKDPDNDMGEMDPMMGKEDMEKKNPPSSSSSSADSSFQSSSSFDSSVTALSYDEDKFIWDKRELDEINKRRKNADKIPVVYRDRDAEFGLRAHP